MLIRRLALAVLRVIVHELEHPAAGGGAPGGLLGDLHGDVGLPPRPVEERAPAVERGQAEEVHEERAQAKRRPRRRARRPARVEVVEPQPEAVAAPAPEPVDAADDEDESAQGCARTLVRVAGGVEQAAERFGFKVSSLTRWLDGRPCDPRTLRRLHEAVMRPLPHGDEGRVAEGQADGEVGAEVAAGPEGFRVRA